MASFEKINSGIKEFDQIVDHVRLGDNVIMQVTKLEDFKKVAKLFIEQAISKNRDVYYIRFATHEPFFEEQEGLKICYLDPSEGFEKFTNSVHKIIKNAGFDAFYVFDCLSDLQVAWSTDLMMGNFFI